MGMCGQRHAPAALCPRERTPGTHCTGSWVGFRAGLDTEVRGKILFPCRGSNPDRPVVLSVVRHYTDCVRFQVLTAAIIKFRIVFWDVLPCKISLIWRQYAPLKRLSTIILHGSTSQKTILDYTDWATQAPTVVTKNIQKLVIRK
jgi:hypothetical protein